MVHFTIYWILPSGNENLQARIVEILGSYNKVMPLPNYYVVQVTDTNSYINFNRRIMELVKNTSILLIMTPLMKGGTYTGMLDDNFWLPLNNITRQ